MSKDKELHNYYFKCINYVKKWGLSLDLPITIKDEEIECINCFADKGYVLQLRIKQLNDIFFEFETTDYQKIAFNVIRKQTIVDKGEI